MKETFTVAAARGSTAIIFVSQADPGRDLSDETRAPLRDPKTLAETDGQPDGYLEWSDDCRYAESVLWHSETLPPLPSRPGSSRRLWEMGGS